MEDLGLREAISPREQDVLTKLGEHLTNAEIAQELHVSVRTVESHVSALLRKLGATDRRALAALASDHSAGAGRGRQLVGAPAVATTFIGRHAEREEIRAAIADDRLVTLLGPGGIGKTRLAIVAATDAAETLPGGATFVDLVPVRAPFLVQAVAAAVGVDEQPGQALQDTLVAELRSRPTLVVLDNCEHLLDVVAPFADTVLAQCPNVRVLATSRERLGLPGERAVRVPPLSMTGTDDVAYTSDAATLFLTRARAIDAAVDPDPNVVDELCARLDGMPLAIELAAARTASLGIAGLQVGLDDRLQLLTGGRHGAERHRSLRAVIEWSHDLLDDEERAVFRRLGVFVGGFDLDAAHAVASGEGVERRLVTDIVGRLVDKSLVVRRALPTGERWQLLETMREYALERLEASGEAPEAHARHLAWSAGVAEALEEQVRAGDERWRPGFEAVIDDLRSALTRAPAGPGPDAAAFRVARATGQLAYARHFLAEAQAHYESASEHAPNGRDAAAALNAAAGVGYARMRIDLSYPLLLQAADRAEADGDAVGAAKALARAAAYTGRCIGELPEPIPLAERSELLARARALAPADDEVARAYLLGAAAWQVEDDRPYAHAGISAEAMTAALAVGDPILISNARDAVLASVSQAGDFRESARVARERVDAIAAFDRLDPWAGGEIIDAFHMGMETTISIGDLYGGRDVAELARRDDLARTNRYLTTSRMIIPLVFLGAFDDALVEAEEMVDAWERAGRPTAAWMAPAACAIALVHGLRRDGPRYDEWLRIARELSPRPTMQGILPFVRARTLMHDGHFAEAHELVRGVEGLDEYYGTYALAVRGELAVLLDENVDAELALAAVAAAESDWASACLARANGRLHDDETELRHALEQFDHIGARFEWACTAVLLPDVAERGHRAFIELGCGSPAGSPASVD